MTSTIRHIARRFIDRQRWWLCSLMLALVVVSALAYRARSSPTLPSDQWVPVQPQLLENHLGIVGSIEAAARTVIAAPFDGVVADVAVVDSQRLERGQRLLTLDTTQLELQLRDAQAAQLTAQRTVRDMDDWPHSEEVAQARRALTRTQLDLNDTEARLADTRRLFDHGIVARTEVDALAQQARTQQLDLIASKAELRTVLSKGEGDSRRIAEMQLANARSRYQILQAQLTQRELVAPFSGTVLRPRKLDGTGSVSTIQQGMRVPQGAPLFELVSLDRVKAVARVEEADLHQLNEGMPVQITGDGFEGIILRGHITSIGVQGISSDTYGGGALYEVVAPIDPLTPEQQQHVRLGMSAQLQIVTYRKEHGFAVPADALRRDNMGRTFVDYRRSMDRPLESVPVTLGRAVSQGVEIFGMPAGYVRLKAQRSDADKG